MTHDLTFYAPMNNTLTMSSLEIAELTGKRHDNVMRDIDNILKELEDDTSLKFEGSYKDWGEDTAPKIGRSYKELVGDTALKLQRSYKELDEGTASIFGCSYKDKSGKENRCYDLPLRETLLLVSGYSTKLRVKIIDRWIELEGDIKPITMGDYLVAQALLFREVERAQAALTQQVGIVANETQARPKK